MKIQCNSVIGVPIVDLNSQCEQCCFCDVFGPALCIPYPWYECQSDIQFKKSKGDIFNI